MYRLGLMRLAPLLTALWLLAAVGHGAPQGEAVVKIKEIRVYGNRHTARSVILHYCSLREGDLVPPGELAAHLERTRDNLLKTLFFARVNVFDLPRSNPAEAVIMIDVAEGTPFHLSATTRQLHFTWDNIGGRALTVGCDAGLDREALFYSQPWVFDWPVVIGTTAFYDPGTKTSVENDAGTMGEWFFHEDAGAYGGLGYILSPRATLGMDFLGQYSYYYNIRIKTDPWNRLGVGSRTTVTAAQPYFKWDRRDSDVFPTRRTYLEIKGELADKTWGDYAYRCLETDMRGYYSPTPRVVLALQILAGVQTGPIPYIRRLSWWGADGLRNPYCHRVNGTRGVLLKSELRGRIAKSPLFDAWFEGLWFADMGRTWDPDESVVLRDWGFATGPGVRVHMRDPLLFDWRAELNCYGDFAFYATATRAY